MFILWEAVTEDVQKYQKCGNMYQVLHHVVLLCVLGGDETTFHSFFSFIFCWGAVDFGMYKAFVRECSQRHTCRKLSEVCTHGFCR